MIGVYGYVASAARPALTVYSVTCTGTRANAKNASTLSPLSSTHDPSTELLGSISVIRSKAPLHSRAC